MLKRKPKAPPTTPTRKTQQPERDVRVLDAEELRTVRGGAGDDWETPMV